MTDKEVPTTPNNIKPIRKGLKINDSPEESVKKEVDPRLLRTAQMLLSKVESGEITELVYIGITEDLIIYSGIVGVVYEPHIMHSQLIHTTTKYYDEVLYPSIEGSHRFGEWEEYDE